MGLTRGSGPFGEHPAGSFNFDPNPPEHVLYLESTPRRVRVVLAGATVADSTQVRVLHPPGRTPTYLFPSEHVRTELFEPSQRRRVDPGMGAGRTGTCGSGTGMRWTGRTPGSSHRTVRPDPYTRIDVLRSSRRVRVRAGDTVVAESTRPRMLLESGLPVRWYLQPEDVRTDLLQPSATTTRCPYKGVAHYWSLRPTDRLEQDIVWSYPEPLHDATGVRGLLCFFNDRVEMEVSVRRGT